MLFYILISYMEQPIWASFSFNQLIVLIFCGLTLVYLTLETSFFLLFDLKVA